MAVRAVGAAAARGAGAGTAAALVGVVEAAALKFNSAGRERLGRRERTTARAHDLGILGHGMLNLKHRPAQRRFSTSATAAAAPALLSCISRDQAPIAGLFVSCPGFPYEIAVK